MKTLAGIIAIILAVFMLLSFSSTKYLAYAANSDYVVDQRPWSEFAPNQTQNNANTNYSTAQTSVNNINTTSANIYANPAYLNSNIVTVSTMPATIPTYPSAATAQLPTTLGANGLSSWGSTYASGNYGYSQAGSLTDARIEPINNALNIPRPEIENPINVNMSPAIAITQAQYPVSSNNAIVDMPKPEKMAPGGYVSHSGAYVKSTPEPIVIPAYKYSDQEDAASGIDENLEENRASGYFPTNTKLEPLGPSAADTFGNPDIDKSYLPKPDQ